MSAEPRAWSAATLTPAEIVPYEARFRRRVAMGSPTECWLWTGAPNRQGYGRCRVGYGRKGGRGTVAPRAAWVLHTGRTLPAHLSIDHLCRTPLCVNPRHLEPVTIHENQRRRQAKIGSPEGVESQVQSLLLVAEVDKSGRQAGGGIRRHCPLCDKTYGTDYLADHIRRHIVAGPKYRHRRVRPRDGSEWNSLTCPDCGMTLAGHIRRHRERAHGVAV